MAVIYRHRLTGEAQDIKDKAVAEQIAMGNQYLMQIQQQKSILDAQQQGLVQATNQTLGQVQDNIYQAKRQVKAEQAALGFVSDVSAVREQAEMQDMIAQELSNVIDQSEQGAISIAGQQSALNEAETQGASASILDQYADTLIEQGKAKQDIGRQVWSGLTGALGGAITGALGGTLVGSGTKTWLNSSTGMIKKTFAGAGLAGGIGLGINQIGNLTNAANENNGNGETLYSKKRGNQILTGLLLGGAVTGAGLGFLDKKELLKPLGARRFVGLERLGGAGAKVLSKSNLIMAGIGAGIGAITGGITAGLDKKYTLNIDDIRGDDTFQQFEDFGLDLDTYLEDIVKDK